MRGLGRQSDRFEGLDEEQMGKDSEKEGSPPPAEAGRKGRRLKLGCLASGLAVVVFAIVGGLVLGKWTGRMPGTGVSTEPILVDEEDVDILFDTTGHDANGVKLARQEIFDTLLSLVADAGDTIVLDMFLANQFGTLTRKPYRDTTGELVEALVRRKSEHPDTWILLLTDPVNSAYAFDCPPALRPLVEAGVHVVLTDLEQLADLNRIYSPFSRIVRPVLEQLRPMHGRVLSNPLEPKGDKISLIQFFRLLDFKANHRKVAIVRDKVGSWRVMVTSANPHSASSAFANTGVVLRRAPVREIYRGELLVARASILRRPELCCSRSDASELLRDLEKRLSDLPEHESSTASKQGTGVRVRYCTEGAIGETVDWMLKGAGRGDQVDLLMFYLSDPQVISGIKACAERGARVRLLLDPNREAFGRGKNGVPNTAVAWKLHRWAQQRELPLEVRWFVAQGEQGHFKMLRVHNRAAGREQLLTGSANFTIRNLRGYNLEAAVLLEDAHRAGETCGRVFTDLWENRGGVSYSSEIGALPLGALALCTRKAYTVWNNLTGACTY